MILVKNVIINADIKKAWKILGTEFADAYKWASIISHSNGSGQGFNGSMCSERACSTTMGGIKERLTKFSNENYYLSYIAYMGMPFMVKSAENSWKLNEIGKDKTRLEMTMNIELKGIVGFLMGPMMKMKMSKMGEQICEEFKYYVENGIPHPRKIKLLNK